MYGLGKKELLNATLTQLAELAVFFNQQKGIKAQPLDVKNNQEQKLNEFILFQIKDLKYTKLKVQRLLDTVQKKYMQNGALYQWATMFKNQYHINSGADAASPKRIGAK